MCPRDYFANDLGTSDRSIRGSIHPQTTQSTIANHSGEQLNNHILRLSAPGLLICPSGAEPVLLICPIETEPGLLIHKPSQVCSAVL